MTLLKTGDFVSHSGLTLPFKINCDLLTQEDINCIAKYIAARCDFGVALGIVRGGIRLAEALDQYATQEAPFNVLVVDDVLTTGKSMERSKAKLPPQVHQDDVIGWVIFARTEPPKWINYVFKTSEDTFK
jgi:hypoxanthine phosphoribosyltransferase